MTRGGALAVAALAGSLLAARPVVADEASDDEDIVGRKMGFAERGGNLVLSTRFGEIFDEEALEALSSGFATTLAVRVYVYKQGVDMPVAVVVAQLDLVYDLWDEVYTVRTQGPLGSSEERTGSRKRAVAAMTQLDELPVAPLAKVAIGPRYFAAVVVELNPVSPELLAEMRRWLTRPADQALDQSSSFFGSFVSVFVNPRLEQADRTIKLRSQPFYRTGR